MFAVVIFFSVLFRGVWSNPAPKADWISVRYNTGGNIVASSDSGIYISNNYGLDWSQVSTCAYYASISTSSDGKNILATGAIIHTTCPTIMISNDSGVTWTKASFPYININLVSSSMSASGQYAVVLAYENSNGKNQIYVSADYGKSFLDVDRTDAINLSAIAMSESGERIIFGQIPGGLFLSNDYGKTFNPWSSHESHSWATLSCSSECDYITSARDSKITVSSDGGLSWNNTVAPGTLASFTAVSSSGQYQFAGVKREAISYSHDFGATWVQSTSGPRGANLASIACDPTGQYLAAPISSGTILLSNDFGVTWN